MQYRKSVTIDVARSHSAHELRGDMMGNFLGHRLTRPRVMQRIAQLLHAKAFLLPVGFYAKNIVLGHGGIIPKIRARNNAVLNSPFVKGSTAFLGGEGFKILRLEDSPPPLKKEELRNDSAAYANFAVVEYERLAVSSGLGGLKAY